MFVFTDRGRETTGCNRLGTGCYRYHTAATLNTHSSTHAPLKGSGAFTFQNTQDAAARSGAALLPQYIVVGLILFTRPS
jgi:hypothetical protein